MSGYWKDKNCYNCRFFEEQDLDHLDLCGNPKGIFYQLEIDFSSVCGKWEEKEYVETVLANDRSVRG